MLAPLGFDLAGLIGVSDRFTAVAVEWIEDQLSAIDAAVLESEASAGFGEALALAHYKALVVLKHQPKLLSAVTQLLLQYRFRCALEGLDDARSQAFWLSHGLDRELQESSDLHAMAQHDASRLLEWLCFGRYLPSYFGMRASSGSQVDPKGFNGFKDIAQVAGNLWQFCGSVSPDLPGHCVYLVLPRPCVGVVDPVKLCELVSEVLPKLPSLYWQPDGILCFALGTRKVSISRQGVHSSSTYFDTAKPVPFSLNRCVDPYLVITKRQLTDLNQLRSCRPSFAPLLDSMSTLLFRDPVDYHLGDRAFLHQPITIRGRQSLFKASKGAAALLPTTAGHCLVEGLLMQRGNPALALTPCHDLSDRYARRQGLSGHGPSGVMNQSVVLTDQGTLSTWRYERNFDSWSGRSADIARHPSLNFLAWQPVDDQSATEDSEWIVKPLTYSGYPSECRIEDLRLFTIQDRIYAISAVILSHARYRQWLPDISADASAHNTIDDMLVIQAIGELNPLRADLAFWCLPTLQDAPRPDRPQRMLPCGFEKNWLIDQHRSTPVLLYSVQPWITFEATTDLQQWRLRSDQALNLPAGIQGPLRNSAHPFVLRDQFDNTRIGLVVHRRRQDSYIYDQYLIVLSSDSLEPVAISAEPILSVNSQAIESDLGFRKNPGVCYVSSVVVADDTVSFLFNLFDCRTCVLDVALSDLVNLIDDPSCFVRLRP